MKQNKQIKKADIKSKVCKICKEEKLITNFRQNIRGYYSALCVPCDQKRARAYQLGYQRVRVKKPKKGEKREYRDLHERERRAYDKQHNPDLTLFDSLWRVTSKPKCSKNNIIDLTA